MFDKNQKSVEQYKVCYINGDFIMGTKIVNEGNAGGDIIIGGKNVNVCKINNEATNEIFRLLNELKELIDKEECTEDEKAGAIDCVEVIEEQVLTKEPKIPRIKNAWKNLVEFASVINGASKIKSVIEEVKPCIEQFIESSSII